MEKHINIIVDAEGKKIVLINDIRFKGKTRKEWKEKEAYLKEYIKIKLSLAGIVMILVWPYQYIMMKRS